MCSRDYGRVKEVYLNYSGEEMYGDNPEEVIIGYSQRKRRKLG